MTELTMAAALLFMFAFSRYGAANCFSVRNVHFALNGLNSIFTFHLRKNMVEVHVTHAMENDLMAFRIFFDATCRIFFTDTQESIC